MIERLKRDGDKNTCLNLKFAARVVPDLDDNSLLGLTIYYALYHLCAEGNNLSNVMLALENLYERLLFKELPKTFEWVDALNTLGCVRILRYSKPINYFDIFRLTYDGLSSVGIENNSPAYDKAVKLMADNGIPATFLVPNEFCEGYSRINLSSQRQLDVDSSTKSLSAEQKDTIRSIFNLYNHDKQFENEIKSRIDDELSKRKNIKIISDWIMTWPYSFELSGVGIAIANIKANLLSPDVPSYKGGKK